ncbi:MAG: sulfatase-like hydrolase/transferase [Proteiniphilum sp.]|nr:sulfatase-like hydrolase/transferase [Proteiniphilum sp.]
MKEQRTAFYTYCLLLYLATLPLTGWFAWHNDGGTGLFRLLYLTSTWLAYTGIVLIPAFLAATIGSSGKPGKNTSWITWAGRSLAVLLGFLVHFFLLADAVMLVKFGYHINGLVVNLLTTPGGFESMGLEANTLLTAGVGLGLLLVFHYCLMFFCLKSEFCTRLASHLPVKTMRWSFPLWTGAALLLSLLCTGMADFRLNQDVLCTIDAFPHAPTMRMRRFLRKIGMKGPKRTDLPRFTQKDGSLIRVSYPLLPIDRLPRRSRPNVIWLVGESLRADLLSPEIMPSTWEFSRKGCRFAQHYSGGHGTRPGMFSMFYGLYGNCWGKFLHSQRGRLLIDWLVEDNYQFLCMTSARFTYPEFDRTIFAALPESAIHEESNGKAWERDIRLIDRAVAFLDSRDKNRPFFLFGFFESTHAPYTFPPEQAMTQDYLENINYATVSAQDAKRLYNRDVNAAHHIDNQLARLFTALENTPELLENTIVVITGDHGEEFYEKGFLGHNSTFVQEQIRVPLVIRGPGVTPSVYEGMSHHTDIVPSLAPLLGVVNPPEDYSVGGNLFSPEYHRSHMVVCGWETAAFISTTHKMVLPLGTKGRYFSRKITTLQDEPCSNQDDFYRVNASELQKVQHDMFRFMKN